MKCIAKKKYFFLFKHILVNLVLLVKLDVTSYVIIFKKYYGLQLLYSK